MRGPIFVANFVASFVEIGLDEVPDKARDKGNTHGLSNKFFAKFMTKDEEERHMKPSKSIVSLSIVSLVLLHVVCGTSIGDDHLLSNTSPVEVKPPAPAPDEKPTWSDPQGRLEVIIDAEHGYLKCVRFPDLYEEASVRSIDRYAVFDGFASTELDDEVTQLEVHTDSEKPQIVVSCLNRASRIAVRKIYTMDPARHEIVKTVEMDAQSEMMVALVSATVLSDEMREGGYYYQYQSHINLRLMSFPTASIGEAYRLETGDDLHSAVLTVTRPDADFTYGEVHLFTNDTGEHLVNVEPDFLNIKMDRVTLLTKDGWQLPRGGWLQLGPGRGAQRVGTLYHATRGTHLMWHDDYVKRHLFPTFAPDRPFEKFLDMAFDASFIRQYQVAEYVDGRLELFEKQTINGGIPEFKRLERIVEGLGPRAWAPCVLYETTFSHGDHLSDNFYFTENARGGFEDLKIIKTKEYLEFVKTMQRELPRFHLLNYERGTYWGFIETIQKHPELALFSWGPLKYGETEWMVHRARWEPHFRLLGDKYVELQKEGLSLYTDGSFAGINAKIQKDGSLILESHEIGYAGEKKMADRLRAAGGMYWSNQPSGPYTDVSYFEGQWDAEIKANWRYMGDRLQLYKLHEFRPNTMVALFLMCDEYIHHCLAYNLVPNLNDRIGTAYQLSRVPDELAKLRWPLREARMAPVPLRPVVWEEPDSPLETVVMTLPGTVYLAAILHSTNGHTANLSVDLNPIMDHEPFGMWKASVTEGPWVGLPHGNGLQPAGASQEPYTDVYKDVAAEVTVEPVLDAHWDGLRLSLPDVNIPPHDSVFFFLATQPAVVRSVEGMELPWPLGSQPHIRISPHGDGTLLVQSDYIEAVLAVSPDWIEDDTGFGAPDGMLGWPTITVRPGTWRLTTDGRLLYHSLAAN